MPLVPVGRWTQFGSWAKHVLPASQTYSARGPNMLCPRADFSAPRPIFLPMGRFWLPHALNMLCPRAEHGQIMFSPRAGQYLPMSQSKSARGHKNWPVGIQIGSWADFRSIRPGALAARQTKPCNISHEYTNDVTLKTFYRHNLVIHIAPINISSPLYFHSVSQISIVHQ